MTIFFTSCHRSRIPKKGIFASHTPAFSFITTWSFGKIAIASSPPPIRSLFFWMAPGRGGKEEKVSQCSGIFTAASLREEMNWRKRKKERNEKKKIFFPDFLKHFSVLKKERKILLKVDRPFKNCFQTIPFKLKGVFLN